MCPNFFDIRILSHNATSTAEDCPKSTECRSGEILCWNGICTNDVAQCPEYVVCPLHLPFKCPHGECRASFLDCPQPINCPYLKTSETAGKVCAGE